MIRKRWRLFYETAIAVAVLLLVKFIVRDQGWEFLSVTPFHTSILAGTIFLLGFILSSIHADYKESEKIPVGIVSALESMYQDGVLFRRQHPEFRLDEYRQSLREVLRSIQTDVYDHGQDSLVRTRALAAFAEDMERLGAPANYIVKWKQDQATVMRNILRMRYLLKIQPLPSAFILIELIVYGILGMLLFTPEGDLVDGLVVTGFFAMLYIYLLKLIRIMDVPFHAEDIPDDVNLFLLDEQRVRLDAPVQ